MTDKLERVARALCAEKCAFMGEPPCYSVEGEWPNPNCQEPGCHAEAKAAIAALEPVTVKEAARVLLMVEEMEAVADVARQFKISEPAFFAALRALAERGE